MALKKTKIFVIDTNVILHDHQCIFNFQDNDVVLPITVLEELDKFKRGSDQLNYQAREFVRLLDDLVKDDLFNGGLSLGPGKGKLKIETGKGFSDRLKASFREDIADHRILAITEYIKENNTKQKVVLITKDINLRMKAKSLGIDAEDYKNDKVTNTEIFDRGVTLRDKCDDSLVARIYEQRYLPLSESGFEEEPDANDYFIFKGANTSALVRYDGGAKRFERVDKKTAYGIKPRNAEQTFLLNALLNPEIKLVAVTGKAGTGKTLLALAAAIAQNDIYDQILLARPIVALSNRDIGFLPGDADEKIRPYMQPLFDNLTVIKHCYNPRSVEYTRIEEMEKEERLVIAALAYIRGRSLSNSYFIIDEAQNLTPHEVKTIITRAGEGTKMVFTGDLHQIDSPYLDQQSNGLAYLSDRMKGQELFAHINLVKGERSYLAELASDLL
ncbi:MAG TPA: PhoH family protein [Prolixibacteraceae bacterium]|nr:PhoH family protein [Prolixibacteraceae bacterium]